MANEKVLNTRIQLKYDSFAEWSSKNPTLRAGEVAIAYLTTAGAVSPATGDTQHPVMFKVGPGKFNDLPWASALAADVHAWAKKSETDFKAWVKGLVDIGDIDAYSKAEVDAKFTANATADQAHADAVAATAKSEAIAAANAHAAELIAGLDVTDTAVTGKYVSAVNEVDGKVVVSREDLPVYTLATGSANGTVAFNGADVAVKGLGSAAYTNANAYDVAGAAATAKSEAIAAAEEKVNALKNGDVKANADAIAAINNGTTGILAQAQAYADQAEADAVATAAADAAAKVKALADDAVAKNTAAIAGIKNGAAINDFAAAEAAIAAAKKAGDDADDALEAYKTTNDAAVALKASNADLEAEIARAKAAEKANADAIELLTNGVDQDKVDGVKDLIDYVEKHGPEVVGMKEDIAANAKAIADEAKRADDEEKRLAGLIADNADDIAENARAIAALNAADGKVANATMADKANSLTDAAKEEVKAVKVNNATNADKADSLTDNAKAEVKAVKVDNAAHADDADKLGGVAAADYATKAYADQAEADAVASANANTAEVIKNYYTKGEADAAFMDATETGNAIDAKITALNLGTTYEPIGAETRAKAYADGLAGNYATAAQGAKADSALQAVEVGTGLKVSEKANNKQTIEIDTDVVFVFNCGNASTLVD